MPVSKHRRKKSKAVTVTATPQVPTRRMREAYVAATPPEDRAAALDEAKAVMGRGRESGFSRVGIAAAYKALTICPLCAEAYCYLAEEATREDDELIDYYKRGIHAAELAVGPEAFERLTGSFWSVPETRPYMEAVHGLAEMLLAMEREDDAVPYLETLIRLNPADDQGARYPLLAYYLDAFDLQPARDLLAAFADENSATWLYSRLLLAYRDELQSDEGTHALVEAAVAANRYVPGILSQLDLDAFVHSPEENLPGSAEEATAYVIMYEDAWNSTPGAVAWLVVRAGAAGVQFP